MQALKQRLRALSGTTELVLVLAVAFGPVVPHSLAALFGGLAGPEAPPITNAALLRSALFEILILIALGLFLRARGWTAQRLGLAAPAWRDAASGVALAVACYLGYVLLWNFTLTFWPRIAEIARATRLIGGLLHWPTMVLVSLVNPVFEEVLLCGYLVTVLRERAGLSTAINASAGIRVFCHFYQGALGVLGIVPMALLFAWWYARTSRLWPLIIAHALLDIAGLAFGR